MTRTHGYPITREVVAGWGLLRSRMLVRCAPHFASVVGGRLPQVEDETSNTQVDEAREAMENVRQQLLLVPAETVVTNHIMGLYELAAIHLGASPPNLVSAALAIDAVACLVEGLGDRIGPDAATMRDALANIRLAFVQIKNLAV
jgi:hypothetical protein